MKFVELTLFTVKNLVLCQIVASLKGILRLVKHIVNLLHSIWTELFSFLLIGIFYQVFPPPIAYYLR